MMDRASVLVNPSKWDIRFMRLAFHIADWSRDPSTKVGAVIVRPNKTIASVGFNGFGRGVDDHPERYADRQTKYGFIVHGEVNAIVSAREPLDGYTLYSTLMTCNECAKLVIQSGIKCIVAPSTNVDRWAGSFVLAMAMYSEAGVSVSLVEPEAFAGDVENA